jgi:hypothetical protein
MGVDFLAFDDCYIPEPNSGCWLWLRARNSKGYGTYRKSTYAHRLSWLMHRGEIPDGLLVCHKCDVRCCVNPDHLFLGTAKDNTQDMIAKGRVHRMLGVQNPNTPLVEADIHSIRADPRPYKDIAGDFGVTPNCVSGIKGLENWSHIPNRGVVKWRICKRLSVAQVAAIRSDRRINRLIAADYGLSKGYVSELKRGLYYQPKPTPQDIGSDELVGEVEEY